MNVSADESVEIKWHKSIESEPKKAQ
jgi:hypothetical protein